MKTIVASLVILMSVIGCRNSTIVSKNSVQDSPKELSYQVSQCEYEYGFIDYCDDAHDKIYQQILAKPDKTVLYNKDYALFVIPGFNRYASIIAVNTRNNLITPLSHYFIPNKSSEVFVNSNSEIMCFRDLELQASIDFVDKELACFKIEDGKFKRQLNQNKNNISSRNRLVAYFIPHIDQDNKSHFKEIKTPFYLSSKITENGFEEFKLGNNHSTSILLGQNLKDIERKLDKPLYASKLTTECDLATIDNSIQLTFNNKKLVYISVLNSKYPTDKGYRVGDTVKKLKKLYPEAKYHVIQNTMGDESYLVQSEYFKTDTNAKGNYYIFFDADNDNKIIDSIDIYNTLPSDIDECEIY